ncbi:MAG TPA: flagellar basal body L-ring protein FlgH [Lacipirellula sp.]
MNCPALLYVVCWSIALAGASVQAQDSSLLLAAPQAPAEQSLSLQTGSFIYRDVPPNARPRELQVHDIITVIVDYRTRMLSEGDAENRKTNSLNAVLSSWIRFDGKSIKAAAQNDGDPRIAGTYNSQYRAESDVELRDSLTFEIAAEIIEIRPNGNLYIEGNQTIRNNEEEWKIFISGEVDRAAIQPDRTVDSNSIAKLDIHKEEDGQVRDGYARGWFNRWYDKYKPF